MYENEHNFSFTHIFYLKMNNTANSKQRNTYLQQLLIAMKHV